jgi:hypothetical protein
MLLMPGSGLFRFRVLPSPAVPFLDFFPILPQLPPTRPS